jgi:hypothetical protein
MDQIPGLPRPQQERPLGLAILSRARRTDHRCQCFACLMPGKTQGQISDIDSGRRSFATKARRTWRITRPSRGWDAINDNRALSIERWRAPTTTCTIKLISPRYNCSQYPYPVWVYQWAFVSFTAGITVRSPDRRAPQERRGTIPGASRIRFVCDSLRPCR